MQRIIGPNQLDSCAAPPTMWARLSLLCAAAVVPLASGQNAGVDSSVSEDACVLADGPDVRLGFCSAAPVL